MSVEAAMAGEYGGSWIVPDATTTPETNNAWRCLYVVSDMEVTAIAGANVDGTHGTKTWKAGSIIPGVFTSITCSNTQTGGLIWATYKRPSVA